MQENLKILKEEGIDIKQSMIKFQEFLINKGLLCTIRASKGLDISAACGQLREKNLKQLGCKIVKKKSGKKRLKR